LPQPFNFFRSFFLTLFLSAGILQAQMSRDEAWREDLSAFKNGLTERHIDLFNRISKSDFEKNITALEANIAQLQDYEIAVELMKILALVGDSHTNITPWANGTFRQFPLEFTVLKDGIFVTKAEDERILKAKLIAVNSLKTKEVLKKLETLIPHENPQRVKAVTDILLQTPEVLQALDIIENMESVEFSFEKDGEIFIESIAPQTGKVALKNVLDELSDDVPAYQMNEKIPYWFGYFDDSRTIYVQYNACVEMPRQSFKNFTEEVFTFAEEHGATKFVLDMRNNTGGDSRIIHPMVSALKRNAQFNKRGNLFVITGERTFSSAVLNTLLVQDNTQAILIGEATGAAPNHFGEVKSFSLPNSTIRVTYSTRFLKTSDAKANTIVPDILAERTSVDYFSGRDRVMEAILKYKISMGF